ncbi:endonuclease domain-containing 1 protein-like isoform X2 [Hyla sarda]|nr:endonuclease domain-containing 1 protein-like isoform X2 [Hyla sarda]XP_056425135.1 endonuclease domain-containing 1 protein-like isoform X2 [Hyla sarda]
MKLLLIISLFFGALIGAHAEVSNNFDNCKNYFYKQQIPRGFEGIAKADLFDRNDLPDGIIVNDLGSPAYICQTFDSTSWFATLYDRGRLMPLYSAYILESGKSSEICKRHDAFSLEPQLVYRGVDKNMKFIDEAKRQLKAYNKEHNIEEQKPKNRPIFLLQTSQAIDEDYTKVREVGYGRGHINPCGHQTAHKEGYKATFTLTNVVPIVNELNNNYWSKYEKEMINMAEQCTRMYVITGIVPGNVPIGESRLTSPTHVWNAYCCVDNNDKPMKSGAALADNKNDSKVEPYNILDFQSKLQSLLNVNIELFKDGCMK